MDDGELRELVPRASSVLVRRGADFATAEDAVQEALIRALSAWQDEPPDDPKGWLVTVAWRSLPRHGPLRHRAPRREERGSTPNRRPATRRAADDTLHLYFLCAHPDLTLVVGGRPDAARRRRPHHPPDRAGLPRAGGDDGAADQPRQAHGRRRPDRRPATSARCCAVLYLVFNEGYSGDVDLAAEAIRLTRQLAALADDPRSTGCSR